MYTLLLYAYCIVADYYEFNLINRDTYERTDMMRSRKAISAVLTTIIILVASIVLGTGVVVYSTSLFQSGGQQQAIQIQGLKTWVNGTYTSGVGGPGGGIGWGAAAIKNTGDKLLAINSITIRGASVPFSNWYAETNQTRASLNFQAQLNYTKNDINGNIREVH